MNGGITNIVGAAPDLSRYQAHVAHLGLSPEKEADLLLSLWWIMGNFVDRAWGDDPVQHVHETRIRDEMRRAVMVKSTPDNPQHQDTTDLSSAFRPRAGGRRGKEDS